MKKGHRYLKLMAVLAVALSAIGMAHAMEVSPSIPDNVVSSANLLDIETDNNGHEVALLEIVEKGTEEDMDRGSSRFYVDGLNISDFQPGLYNIVIKKGYKKNCPDGALLPDSSSPDVPNGWACVYEVENGEMYVMSDEYVYGGGQDFESSMFDIRIDGMSAIVEGRGASTLSLPVNNIESAPFTGEDGKKYYAVRSAVDEMMVFGDLDFDNFEEKVVTVSNADGTQTIKISNVQNPEDKVLVLWDNSWLANWNIKAADYYFVPHQPNTRTWAESPYWSGAAHANMYYKKVKRTTWLNLVVQEKDVGDQNVFQSRVNFEDNPDIGLKSLWVGNKFPITGSIMAFMLGSQELYTDSSHTYKVQERNQYNAEAYRKGEIETGSLLFEYMGADNTLEQFVMEVD